MLDIQDGIRPAVAFAGPPSVEVVVEESMRVEEGEAERESEEERVENSDERLATVEGGGGEQDDSDDRPRGLAHHRHSWCLHPHSS